MDVDDVKKVDAVDGHCTSKVGLSGHAIEAIAVSNSKAFQQVSSMATRKMLCFVLASHAILALDQRYNASKHTPNLEEMRDRIQRCAEWHSPTL